MNAWLVARLLIGVGGAILGAWQAKVSRRNRTSVRLSSRSVFHTLREILSSVSWIPIGLFVLWPPSVAWATYPSPIALRWVGNALLAAGFFLWAWAQASMGSNWDRKVAIHTGHSLVRTGPFRYARHPMYGSFILVAVGITLATSNLLIAVLFGGHIFLTVIRAPQEERLLEENIPEYAQYRQKVKRWYFPFL